jgi:16S rRNA (uracil1498-N3)-methyltransferase
MVNALKQCGRLFLPQLLLKPSLSHWEKPSGSLFFGDLSKAPKLSGPFSDSVTFFIGPEKGFSPAEIAHLKTFSAHGISLHTHTLRAETAAIVALSQYFVKL